MLDLDLPKKTVAVFEETTRSKETDLHERGSRSRLDNTKPKERAVKITPLPLFH